MRKILIIVALLFLASCTNSLPEEKMQIDLSKHEIATFAGGCFWCIESAMQQQPGVIEAVTGYTGGSEETATYSQTSTGKTKHFEAVQVYFDPQKISYEELLTVFWTQIDPTDEGGQFSDRGPQYKTAIFYHDVPQQKLAEKSFQEIELLEKFDTPVVTQILPANEFYKAEEYHQDYFIKKSEHYNLYKEGSGRSGFIKKVWGDLQMKNNNDDLKEQLTDMQYEVTQEGATEPAFDNEYWDNKEDGIYVDIITSEPLFSSKDKFDSGTGWPSFTKTINEAYLQKEEDDSLGMQRTELKTKDGSHLGHVFDDGPDDEPRFCVNSASMRFISKDKLVNEGFEKYLILFEN